MPADLAAAIVECLSLHAQAMAKFGTERPEQDGRISSELRAKIEWQRAKVSTSFDYDPETHRRHIESLNKGLRLILRQLGSAESKAPPPLPIWDDQVKAWRVPTRVEALARQFDERGPNDPNELFHD
jgi:hypothetical protein